MTTAQTMSLDPQIATLCDGPRLPSVPALSRPEAERLCTTLALCGTSAAFALGWKPQHVEIWLPVVQATFAAVAQCQAAA